MDRNRLQRELEEAERELTAAPVQAAQCEPGTITGEVTYVRDGDTIELGAMAIRLDGLAAPGMGTSRSVTRPRPRCSPWCSASRCAVSSTASGPMIDGRGWDRPAREDAPAER